MHCLISKTPFYFLRHAQTNHNLHHIYDDENEVALNRTGIQQANEIKKTIAKLPINTVCSSPLRRAQETKEIVLKGKKFKDVIIEDLKECPCNLWTLFLASEARSLTSQEWEIILKFINRIKHGLEQAFRYDGPLLVIAHGGTYWAISYLLNLDGSRKVDNCVLMEVFPHRENVWKTKLIS